MAGEIDRFVSPSIAFEVKPAKSIRYHEELTSKASSIMDDYHRPSEINEDVFLSLLLSDEKQAKALQYLDQHMQKNNGKFSFHNIRTLFKGFQKALSGPSQKACVHCTKLISKIIPQLGVDVDQYMNKLMSVIINNVGSQSVLLQKESIQLLYVYMKHSLDVYQILQVIALQGLQHEDARIRQQVVRSFPTLLFSEFKSEDFFDIINGLVGNLTETQVDHDVLMQVLGKVKVFLGKDAFIKYINRLPSPLRHTYYQCFQAANEKISQQHQANHAVLSNKDTDSVYHTSIASKYPLSIIENTSEHRPGNFSKSGHFDTVSRRRQHGNIYSSLAAVSPYDSSTSSINSHFGKTEQSRFELSFIPKFIIEQMSSSDHTIRLQAIEALKEVLANLKDSYLIKENMVPLLSLLQPVFDDKNYRVACGALRAFRVMIAKIGPDVNSYVKLFVFAISRKLGNVKDSVRSECYKVLLHIMGLVGRQKVLNLFWDKLTHKQYKVREDFVCIVIATLLSSLKTRNYSDLDFDLICTHIAGRLTDNQQVVRQAALDCIAVLGHILGTTNKKLLSAVDSVELKHDNASGIMSAVHARLLRRQLPRLNENMLVEYAVFNSPSATVTSPLGADIQWVLAAEKPKKTNSSKPLYSSQERIPKQLSLEDSLRAKKDSSRDDVILRQSRRHLSAGKHRRQFPWSSQEDVLSSDHPSSAPVGSNFKQVPKTKPPFQPRSTWGPESELSQQLGSAGSSLLTNKSAQAASDTGPSYQELYKRRKEAQASKSGIASNVTSARSSKTDSGYQPSFASRDFSASSSVAHSGTMHEAPSFSNSCPSTFFDKNLAALPPRRLKKKVLISTEESSVSSAYGSKESDSPIRLKPALARSASKRRDNMVAASREFLKTEDYVDNSIPVKLKNASASPRFDRLIGSRELPPTDRPRPILKFHSQPSQSGSENSFPGASVEPETDAVGYTPSGLQKKATKDSTRSNITVRSSNAIDKDNSSVKSESFSNENVNSSKSRNELTKPSSMPTAKPIVPSDFSPIRHKSHEDTAEVELKALNAIRRSAQNKRDRMRSQPGSDDGFSNSFSEYSSGNRPNQTVTSASQQDNYEHILTTRSSSQPVTSNELVSSTVIGSSDPPPFKYSPNNGVTFDSKKVDTNVSVVGVRYPSQAFIGSNSNSPSELKNQAPLTSTTSSSVASSSAVSFTSKVSPGASNNERQKPHRGSALAVSAIASSPDPTSGQTFNIQGKGVFMSPSSTSLLAGSDVNDVTATSSREGPPMKSPTERNKGTKKMLDGVMGVAVKQPSLTPHDFPTPQRSLNDEPVSLSASLRERKERQKEVLSRNSQNLLKAALLGDKSTAPSTGEHGLFHNTISRRTLNEAKIKSNNKAATLPLRAKDSTRRAMLESFGGSGSKPGSSTSSAPLAPLDHPEKSLNDVISSLTDASSEDWEMLTQGMYTVRRLVTHHSQVVSSRFHDVIVLLNKYVSSLRSQVSKASLQAVTDLYTHLKKPVVDTDLEVTVRTLLAEHGKQMSFIRNETSKTLQAIVQVASTNKMLNALISAGLRHKNKVIRSTAAGCCADLVDKMGPGKALSGVKDTTDRLLEAVAVFINDSSPDVRYYGRYIINELMVHEDFVRCVERYLPPDSAQEVKTAANNLKQRGLGSLRSIDGRKGGSGRNRSGASPASVQPSAGSDRFSSSSSAGSRRKGTGSKAFNEQEHEELKSLCDALSGGSLNERKSAIITLFDKLQRDRRFVEDNVIKIMDSYVKMLTTAQTKLNHIALESLPGLIADLHSSLRDVIPQLVPALLKLVASKQYSLLAQENINCLVKYVEPLWIIPDFANIAKHGNAKAKQTALRVLTKLTGVVARKKPQVIERYILPVLWNLVSSHSAPSGVQLRKETAALSDALYEIYGLRLIELAESKNLSGKLKEVLDI